MAYLAGELPLVILPLIGGVPLVGFRFEKISILSVPKPWH